MQQELDMPLDRVDARWPKWVCWHIVAALGATIVIIFSLILHNNGLFIMLDFERGDEQRALTYVVGWLWPFLLFSGLQAALCIAFAIWSLQRLGAWLRWPLGLFIGGAVGWWVASLFLNMIGTGIQFPELTAVHSSVDEGDLLPGIGTALSLTLSAPLLTPLLLALGGAQWWLLRPLGISPAWIFSGWLAMACLQLIAAPPPALALFGLIVGLIQYAIAWISGRPSLRWLIAGAMATTFALLAFYTGIALTIIGGWLFAGVVYGLASWPVLQPLFAEAEV